ncbi:LexA family protein [Aquicella siphonis]|nr:S24 family peptidase [Aquicella siphonis]
MKLSDRAKLCREKLNLTQGEVAEFIGISQPSYQRLEKGGVANPRKIDRLAAVLKASPEWLKFGTGNPPEYLNIPAIPAGKVPLIPWELIKIWHGHYDIGLLMGADVFEHKKAHANANALDKIEYISIPNKQNAKQFAVRVKGDSMISPLPGKRSFLANDILIIDPEVSPVSDNFVIALHGNEKTEPLFAQYIAYAGNRFLKPLNPQYPLIPWDESIQICGVVVAHLDILI